MLFWILTVALVFVAVWAGYFLITKGERAESWIAAYRYAHRGLHGEGVPENSMYAFRRAAESGYGIELDVHLSSDGVPVVIHDDNLKRMTGMDRAVSALDAKTLSNLFLAGSKEGVPLFEDVLHMVNGRVPLLIEIKSRGKAGELEEKTWALLKQYDGLFAVQSFSPYSLGWFSAHAPEVLRGQLSSAFRDLSEPLPAYQVFGLKHLLTNFMARPNFISYEIDDLPRKVVSRLRKKGLPILGWTIRTEEQLKKANRYCDTVIFENNVL